MINSMSLPCNEILKEDRSHREAVFFFFVMIVTYCVGGFHINLY